MNCPICGLEMEKGELHSRGGVFFLPEGETMPKLYTQKEMERHRAISLPPYLLREPGDYPTACVCRACRKVIIDF